MLLPALPPEERPNIIVGASVGAVNGAYLAATHDDPDLSAGRRLWEEIARHLDDGRLISAAVVATSALTGRSVVFHQGGTPDEVRDDKRGIDSVPTVLNEQHVRASAAIPAVEVTDGPAAGWYFDGGTRLNAPIKPALSLGAERVIVPVLRARVRPRLHRAWAQGRAGVAGGTA